MAQKCYWCAGNLPQPINIQLFFRGKSENAVVCSKRCESDLRKFVDFANRHLIHYIVGLSACLVAGLLLTFLRIKIDYGALGVLVLFAGSGVLLMVFPFVTPRTVQALGAKKAIASGRLVGAVCAAIGVVFWLVLKLV
jgi:Na+/melibiose symporter-like transporter